MKILRELVGFLVWHLGNETVFLGHQLGLNQLISAGVKTLDAFLHFPFFMRSVLFHYAISHNLWTSKVWFFFGMCGLDGLLPTSGERFMSMAPLESYLLRKECHDFCCFYFLFLNLVCFHKKVGPMNDIYLSHTPA